MQCTPVAAPEDWGDARGPDLVRWLTDADLRFPGVGDAYAPPDGSIIGAISPDHFVIFHGLQVIQIVPDEVHSGWHYDLLPEEGPFGSAWRITDSDWLRTFHPRHLDEHDHFIIRFYDEVIEVICQELLFGRTPFDLTSAINAHPQLAYPYLQLAISLEKKGDLQGALASFTQYLRLKPDPRSIEYAQRSVERLRGK